MAVTEKNIPVELFLQAPGSADCGPCCDKMILDYFGKPTALDQIKPQLHYYGKDGRDGTSCFDNGSYFMSRGLSAKLVTANPLLFPPDRAALWASDADLRSYLRQQMGRRRGARRQCIGELLTFLEAGGSIEIAIPTFAHVRTAIDAGQLVMPCMNARTMGSKEGDYHFVVVSGYREHGEVDEVFINNPLVDSTRQSWKPADRFLYGLHASSLFEVDNGSLLIVGGAQ